MYMRTQPTPASFINFSIVIKNLTTSSNFDAKFVLVHDVFCHELFINGVRIKYSQGLIINIPLIRVKIACSDYQRLVILSIRILLSIIY